MVGGEFLPLFELNYLLPATTDIKINCQGINFNVVYLYCILCVNTALFTQSYRSLVLAGK